MKDSEATLSAKLASLSLTLMLFSTACGNQVVADNPDQKLSGGVSLVAEPIPTIPPPRIPANCFDLIPYTAPHRLLTPQEYRQLIADVSGVINPRILEGSSLLAKARYSLSNLRGVSVEIVP